MLNTEEQEYIDRLTGQPVILVSGCRGMCSGPRCYCVENFRATVTQNPNARVELVPNDDPRILAALQHSSPQSRSSNPLFKGEVGPNGLVGKYDDSDAAEQSKETGKP